MDTSKNRFLLYETTDINDPLLLRNKEEINESEETRARSLQILRENLKSISDIEHCMEENFLLFFLRVAKFNTCSALKRIKSYYKQLDALADTFKKCSMSLQKAENVNFLWMSPYRMPDNSFLLISLHTKVDYRRISFAERFYLELMAFNNVFENPVNQICGLTIIIDLEGFGVHGLFECTPRWIWTFVYTAMNLIPLRVKGVYIINTPTFFPSIYKIAKPLIPEKIKNRVFFPPSNDGWRSLHSSIPPDILPELYNGKIRNELLINLLNNVQELDEKIRKAMAFGYTKTKQKRLSMKVISYK